MTSKDTDKATWQEVLPDPSWVEILTIYILVLAILPLIGGVKLYRMLRNGLKTIRPGGSND